MAALSCCSPASNSPRRQAIAPRSPFSRLGSPVSPGLLSRIASARSHSTVASSIRFAAKETRQPVMGVDRMLRARLDPLRFLVAGARVLEISPQQRDLAQGIEHDADAPRIAQVA